MTSNEFNYLNPPDEDDCTCCNRVYTPCCLDISPGGICIGCDEIIDPDSLVCPSCDNGECADCHGFED